MDKCAEIDNFAAENNSDMTTDTKLAKELPEDFQRMMTEVMARLKPRERELFEMRRLDGLSTKQISEQTGISPRSVTAMVSEARTKVFLELKKRMKQ